MNPILIGKAQEMVWRYYVRMDEGSAFFESGDELLLFLQNNDPIECGARLMTEEEWQKILETRLE